MATSLSNLVPPTVTTTQIIYEGQLCKKGKINKNWKNRYCCLCVISDGEYALEYYDSKLSKNLCGTVDFSQVYAVEVISDYDLSLMKQLPENILINTRLKSEKNYSFQISTANRKFIFAAFDPQQFFTWVNYLDRYVYGGIIKQGFLMKKGDKNRGWKKRYFVLNEYKQIKYYQDFEKTQFCGSIPLHVVKSITNGKVYSDEYKFTFQLITDKRVWILCAKNMKQRDAWHAELRRVTGDVLKRSLTPNTKHTITINHLHQISKTKHLQNGAFTFNNDDQKSNAAGGAALPTSAPKMTLFSATEELLDDEKLCTSIRHCQSLDRIRMNLHFYQTMIESQSSDTADDDIESSNALLVSYFEEHKEILGDYAHLVQFHLNTNRAQSNETFQSIHDAVRKYITCPVENALCGQYRRHLRDRARDDSNEALRRYPPKVLLCMDILDTIHCTFVHSYHEGLRINTSQIQFATNDVEDAETNYLHRLLKLKRKTLPKVAAKLQRRDHKFATVLNVQKARYRSTTSLHALSRLSIRGTSLGRMGSLLSGDRKNDSLFVDDYALGQLLNAGYFGGTHTCWKKDDPQHVNTFAVKQISKAKFYQIEHETRVEMIDNMKNEIAVLRLLEHDNIAQLYDVYEDRKYIYLIMEYLSGGPLFGRIAASKSLTEKMAANITKQILHALSYMQSHNICHFDLKPDNIMFASTAPDAKIKIIDFGYSKVLPRLKKQQQYTYTKPFYCAPEVFHGHYDRAADVWSVGVIVFCMLFGFPPFYVDADAFNNFGKKEEEEIFELIKKGFIAEVRPGYGRWFPADIAVSDEAKSFIKGMLAYNIADRLTVHECLAHVWIRGDAQSATELPKTVISSLSQFRGTCQFKILVSKLFATKLDSTAYADTLEVFKKWDTDGDGEITLEEFRKGMQEATNLNDEQIAEIFANLDGDDSRTITIDELIVSAAFTHLSSVDERMYQAFCELDTQGRGTIQLDELKTVLKSVDETKEMKDVDAIIAEIDVNDDGEIDYEEFLRALHPYYNKQLRTLSQASEQMDTMAMTKYKFIDESPPTPTSPLKKAFSAYPNTPLLAIAESKENHLMTSLTLDAEHEWQTPVIGHDSFGAQANYFDESKPFYVSAQYENLKSEILQKLSIDIYGYALLKADFFMDSEALQRIESKRKLGRIKKGDVISLEHVLAVILFSDFARIHIKLRTLFYRLNDNETDDMWLQRHRNYYHLLRLLYECVNVFGESLNAYHSSLYHCIDNALFQSFDIQVHGIASFTPHVELAIRCMSDVDLLGDNGLILELNGAGTPDDVRYFDCSFLSFYTNESEKILFDVPNKIQIASVRVMNSGKWENYRPYMLAWTILENALNGNPLRHGLDDDAMLDTKQIYECICNAIDMELEHQQDPVDKETTQLQRFPAFMRYYFHAYCSSKQQIVVDLKHLQNFYEEFNSIFICSVNKSLLKYDQLIPLFPNCTQMITANERNKKTILISSEWFMEIITMMDQINRSKLEMITIINPNIICTNAELESIREQCEEHQWTLNHQAQTTIPTLSLSKYEIKCKE